MKFTKTELRYIRALCQHCGDKTSFAILDKIDDRIGENETEHEAVWVDLGKLGMYPLGDVVGDGGVTVRLEK